MNTLTQHLIEQARSKPHADRTQCEHIILALSDGKWHGTKSLYEQSGALAVHSRMSDLRKKNVAIECEPDPATPKGKCWWRYRLMEDVA